MAKKADAAGGKDALFDELGKAAKGLVFTSETDAPLEPFRWQADKLDAATAAELAGQQGAEVEQMSVADFFRAVPKAYKAKFDALAKLLGAKLSGVTVYKVGDESEKAAYIVGKANDGSFVGVKTTVVET